MHPVKFFRCKEDIEHFDEWPDGDAEEDCEYGGQFEEEAEGACRGMLSCWNVSISGRRSIADGAGGAALGCAGLGASSVGHGHGDFHFHVMKN